MNRPLKFRVWSKKLNRPIPQSEFAINGNGILLITDSGYYTDFQNQNNGDFVIQQFTGLKDKNDREIYEGDILYYCDDSDDDKGEVIWFNSDTQFKVNWRHDSYKGNAFRKDSEIIGNIFENPDLLK